MSRLARRSLGASLAMAMAVACLSVLPLPAVASTTHTPPSSIPADCSRGVTEELNAWFAGLPDGRPGAPSTIDLGAGCYLLNDIPTHAAVDVDGVQVIDKSHWRIRGQATLRFDTTVPTRNKRAINRAALTVRNGHDVGVSGLTLLGTKERAGYDPLLEYDHNLIIMGGSAITVEDITAREAAGDNIAIKPFGTNWPNGVLVSGSKLSNASRHNLSVIGGENITIEKNTMANNGYWVIDAELSHGAWPLRNLVIRDNTANGTRYGFLALSSRSDATAGGVDTVAVTGNTLLNPALTNYEFVNVNASARSNAPTRAVSITNNTFTVRQYGISAAYVSGLTVQGNTARSLATGSAGDCGGKIALTATSHGVSGLRVTSNVWSSPKNRAFHCQKSGSKLVGTAMVSSNR